MARRTNGFLMIFSLDLLVAPLAAKAPLSAKDARKS